MWHYLFKKGIGTEGSVAPSVTIKRDNSTRCDHRWVHLLGISAWCTSDSVFVLAARSLAGCHPWLMIHFNPGASVVGGAVVKGSLCCPLQLTLGSLLCSCPVIFFSARSSLVLPPLPGLWESSSLWAPKLLFTSLWVTSGRPCSSLLAVYAVLCKNVAPVRKWKLDCARVTLSS